MPDKWAGGWSVEIRHGSAAEMHALSANAASGLVPVTRTVSLMVATRPAIVLGSSQKEESVDADVAARLGYDITRRRSGGGAVLVGDGHCIWVDLVIPAGDPLWDDDVGRAAWWVGDLWNATLSSVGAGPLRVWKSPLQRTDWSAEVCFAGVGAGELVTEGGPGVRPHKVFGVSQRRTRAGALFQTATLIQWRPAELAELLGLPGTDLSDEAAEGIGSERAARVWDALDCLLMP